MLDTSVVLAWCLADENVRVADRALEAVIEDGAVLPGIWWYEIRNAFVMNERRGRLTPADTEAALANLRDMPILVDRDHDEGAVLELARTHDLSVYDAAYLEVAQRRELPLATLDRRLGDAAENAGVMII